MRLAGVRTSDIVKCSVRGQVFHAVVSQPPKNSEIRFVPIERGVTHRHATAHQVIEHWRRSIAGGAGR